MVRDYKQADNLQRLPFTLMLFGYCTRCLAFLLGSAVGGGRASELSSKSVSLPASCHVPCLTAV